MFAVGTGQFNHMLGLRNYFHPDLKVDEHMSIQNNRNKELFRYDRNRN